MGSVTLVLILVTLTLLVRYLTLRIAKFYTRSQVEMELDQMFNWFWDGTPEDRLYAWYKVRSVLKQREGRAEQQKVTQVDQKIMQFDKKLINGNFSIDPTGAIITSTADRITEG